MLRDVLRSQKFHILLAIACCYLVAAMADNRCARQDRGLRASRKVNILVTLPFPLSVFTFSGSRPTAGYPLQEKPLFEVRETNGLDDRRPPLLGEAY
jgi:hypothetical protein